MSKIEVNAIEPQCGTNLTVGASGDTITFPSGTTVVNNGSQTGFGRTGTVDWDTTAKTASFTAVSGNGYFVNTTSGAITVTLPATPSANDIVAVADYAGTASTNNITIARNGSPIEGSTIDGLISTNRQTATFIYIDGTQGWVAVNSNDQSFQSPSFITATGGTITTCGNYKIHTFTGPGTFCVSCAGNPLGSDTVSYLVVAGGGAGGVACSAGGGGAGGFRESKSSTDCYSASPLNATSGPTYDLPVTAQGYPITVGGGGSGIAPYTGPTFPSPSCGPSGSNSIFSSITSAGGGGGGGQVSKPGVPGGSGGGGSHSAGPGGSGNTPPVSPPQGQNGGQSAPSTGPAPSDAGAGGGGAGATGSGTPQSGGNGVSTSISTSSTTYAGGGGGTNRCGGGPTCTAGGSGGGGRGGYGSRPTPGPQGSGVSGTANTGGGGGGGKALTPSPACRPFGGSGGGGSGIVIIRYKYQ